MINWLIPLAIVVFFELVADIFSKNWSLHGGTTFALLASASYLIANIFWLFALKGGAGLGRGVIIFSLSSSIIAVLLGIFLYHEKVSNFQLIGMFLGLVSMIFIFWE